MTDAAIAVETPAFSMGEVVSRTFSVIGRHFLLFFGLALLASLPAVLLALLIRPVGKTGAAAAMLLGSRYWITFAATMLVSMILSVLLSAVLTYGTVTDLNGRKPSFSDALATAVRLFFPLVAIAVISTVGFGLGLVALIVPGLMLITAWAVAVPVRVIENTRILDTFSRSAELTKGHRWAIFGLLVVYGAIVLVVSLVSRPVLLAASAAQIGGLPVVYTVADTVIRAVTSVISATGIACLYYELRVSKEGIGPDQLAAVFE